MPEHLFVYGTLDPRIAPPAVRPAVERLARVGPARVRGRLLDLGAYPGLILDPAGGDVHGTLFRLPQDPQVLERLDSYEGFDLREPQSLFARVEARALVEGGGKIDVWLYVYNQDPGPAPVIASGNYIGYLADRASRPIDTGGIPFHERALTHVAIPAVALFLGVPRTTRWAKRILRELSRIASPLSDEALARRTTVRRVLAIEESTRHWSLGEVIEHVLIVNRRVAEIVRILGRREDPGPAWTILDVKPRGRPAAELRAELRAFPDEIEAAAAAVLDWRSPARHPHPWFGSLDARGWWALNALHTAVHRRQAARIAAAHSARLTHSAGEPKLHP